MTPYIVIVKEKDKYSYQIRAANHRILALSYLTYHKEFDAIKAAKNLAKTFDIIKNIYAKLPIKYAVILKSEEEKT